MKKGWDLPGAILLVSCYELGRPPMGVASPMAWLKEAGWRPESADLSLEDLDPSKVRAARLAALSVPMHTALRVGLRAARRIRELNGNCRIVFHGLYARLNAEHLLASVPGCSVIGPEAAEPLLELIEGLAAGRSEAPEPPPARRPRAHRLPDRSGLPPLERYARLEHLGRTTLAGVLEASRGCKHVCRHCPVTPVYNGKFFIVPEELVLEDARRQVEAGAGHLSFVDPDFLNGPAHALRVARALHRRHPGVTFDFTAKVEHLLRHRALLPQLAEAGALFVTSAVESLSDVVLGHLKKGHTAADVAEALSALRGAGLAMRPSLVSFTPWTGLEDFIAALDFVEREGLAHAVDPVHYAIRLLIPPGSPLADLPAMRPHLGPLDREAFGYRWTHPDPRMDQLQGKVMGLVARAAESDEDPARTAAAVRELALSAREGRAPRQEVLPLRAPAARPPRLTESWFCCAEPAEGSLDPA